MVSIRKAVLCTFGAVVVLLAWSVAWHALTGSPVPFLWQALVGFSVGALGQYAYYRWTRA